MSAESALRGVLPVVQTPFGADGELDLAGLEALCLWVIDQGADGLTTGMVSELLRLSTTERLAHSEVVVGIARDSRTISVISCGAESTHGAVAFARHAESSGAHAVMVNPPIGVAADNDELFRYFAAVLEKIAIPLVVQDASGYLGRPLDIHLLTRLLDTFGDQVYFKPEATPIGQRLSALREASQGRARVLEGTGGVALLDSFRRGIVGTMPGSEVCWAITALWSNLITGRWADAYGISEALAPVIAMQTGLDEFVAIEKHLLMCQKVITSTVTRGPVAFRLDEETGAEVERLLARLRDRVDAVGSTDAQVLR